MNNYQNDIVLTSFCNNVSFQHHTLHLKLDVNLLQTYQEHINILQVELTRLYYELGNNQIQYNLFSCYTTLLPRINEYFHVVLSYNIHFDKVLQQNYMYQRPNQLRYYHLLPVSIQHLRVYHKNDMYLLK